MRTTVLCHPDDIAADRDFAELGQRGLGSLTVNVLYHDWVCWTPLSRRTPLRREPGGASAVPVGTRHPEVLRPAERPSELAAIAKSARAAGVALDAWTVSLHRDDLARDKRSLRLAPVDAFGTHLTTWVCPSSDEARDYLVAHIDDIAQTGLFDRLVLEGCHYPLLQHGGAHERDLSRVGPDVRGLLGLCFCDACMAMMAEAGHDPARWRADVAAAVYGEARKLTDDARLRDTAALRRERVVSLVDAMRAAAPRLKLTFADQPAIAGETFRTGVRSNPDPARLHAAVGLDIGGVAAAGAGIVCLAYFRSLADVEQHIAFYLEAGVPAGELTVALRPGPPDCTSLEQLIEKIGLVASLGISDIAFYELAQMEASDWRRTMDAIEAVAA